VVPLAKLSGRRRSFYGQAMPFPTRHCPVPSSHANASTGAALVVPTPLARKRSVPDRTVRTASRTESELLQRHPSKPRVPHRPGAVKNRGEWRGDKRVAAGPRRDRPCALWGQRGSSSQQIGRGTTKECCGRWDWPRAIGRCGGGRGRQDEAMRGLPLAIGCPRAPRQGHHRSRCSQQSANAQAYKYNPAPRYWLSLITRLPSHFCTTGRFILTGFKTQQRTAGASTAVLVTI
jgi:hypothetical protein